MVTIHTDDLKAVIVVKRIRYLTIKTCWTKDDIELENEEFTRVLLETPRPKVKGPLIVVAVVVT